MPWLALVLQFTFPPTDAFYPAVVLVQHPAQQVCIEIGLRHPDGTFERRCQPATKVAAWILEPPKP